MEKLITTLLAIFVFCVGILSAQTDTLFVEKLNDTTFVKNSITYDDQGRELTIEKNYFDSVGFSDLLFNMALQANIDAQQKEENAENFQKEYRKSLSAFDNLRKDYLQFSDRSYRLKLTELLKRDLVGTWILRIGSEVFRLSSEFRNGLVLLNDMESDKKARVIILQLGELSLSPTGNEDFFFDSKVVLSERTPGVWFGTTNIDGAKTAVRLIKRD